MKLFRNKEAQILFDKMSKDSYIYESGIDKNGLLYFAYLNGIVKRYTRREFISLAREYKELNYI